MANTSPTPPDPNAVTRAHKDWEAFTRYSTYAVAGVIAILALMAIFLL